MRQASIIVRYHGREYERDLVRCRSQLLRREIEGCFESTAELARKLGLSVSTVAGFFSGERQGSWRTAVRILGAIGLDFPDVHREVGRVRW